MTAPPYRAAERALTANFISYYASRFGLSVSTVSYPEDSLMPGEIDALGELSPIGRLAVEHTQLETYKYQIRSESLYRRYVVPFQTGLENLLPCGISIEFPLQALTTGKRGFLKNQLPVLREWVLVNHMSIPTTRTDINVPGVPFPIRLTRGNVRRGRIRIYFPAPEAEIGKLLCHALTSKASKLGRYQVPGTATVLLVESADFQLMNPLEVFLAYRQESVSKPGAIDQLWLAERDPTQTYFHCLDADPDIMDQGNANEILEGWRDIC